MKGFRVSTQDLGFIHQFVPAEGVDVDGTTLLLLHGTGGDETDLLGLGRELAPGAALLSPRGKVLERGMPRFFRRLAEGVFDLEDLKARTHELAGFVSHAARIYGFDPSHVVGVGYSNGANIAASLLLLHAMVPLVPEELPDLSGVPVFLSAGRADRMVPGEESERLSGLLRDAGADVHLHWEEGGHSLSLSELRAAREWLVATGLLG